jgi:hypothetical protein
VVEPARAINEYESSHTDAKLAVQDKIDDEENNMPPKNEPEPKTQVIYETDNFMAWSAEEPDGETTYHLELNNVTLHFFREEWEEFVELAKALAK